MKAWFVWGSRSSNSVPMKTFFVWATRVSNIFLLLGWLEPLLLRVKDDPGTAIAPVIDSILDKDLAYAHGVGSADNFGGFTWENEFAWFAVPAQEQNRRQQYDVPAIEPIK